MVRKIAVEKRKKKTYPYPGRTAKEMEICFPNALTQYQHKRRCTQFRACFFLPLSVFTKGPKNIRLKKQKT